MIGIAIIAIAAFCALFAGVIAPYDPTAINTSTNNMDPLFVGGQYTNSRYLLGSDQLGRDILSRLIWSARISMVVGLVPTLIVFTTGCTLGLGAGYFGGRGPNPPIPFTLILYPLPAPPFFS